MSQMGNERLLSAKKNVIKIKVSVNWYCIDFPMKNQMIVIGKIVINFYIAQILINLTKSHHDDKIFIQKNKNAKIKKKILLPTSLSTCKNIIQTEITTIFK